MSIDAIKPTTKACEAFYYLTETETSRQKIIQALAFVVIANAIHNALQARALQSTFNLSIGYTLWTAQDAFLHKALSENVQSIGAHAENLETQIATMATQIDDMNTLIESMNTINSCGSTNLVEQGRQLVALKEERAQIEVEREKLSDERKKLSDVVTSMQTVSSTFSENYTKTNLQRSNFFKAVDIRLDNLFTPPHIPLNQNGLPLKNTTMNTKNSTPQLRKKDIK